MTVFTAFYSVLVLFGVVVLIMAFFAQSKFKKNADILNQHDYPIPEKKKKKKEGKKNQKQIEVEGIIAGNHMLINFLFTLDKNITVKFLMIFVTLISYYYFADIQNISDMGIPALLIMIFFIVFPSILGGSMIKSKLKKMMADFPGFIDLVAVNLQSGLSIEGSIK